MSLTTAVSRISDGAGAEVDGSDYIHAALRRKQVTLWWRDIAADSVAQVSFGPLPYAVKFRSAKFIPALAVTADDTDYATITVGSDNGAAGGITTLQEITTETSGSGGTGDLVAGTAVALGSITNADTVAAGKYLTVLLAKAASGVVTAGSVVLDFDYE